MVVKIRVAFRLNTTENVFFFIILEICWHGVSVGYVRLTTTMNESRCDIQTVQRTL